MILHPDVTDTRIKNRFKTLEADLYAIWGDKLDFTDSVYVGVNYKIEYLCNICQDYKISRVMDLLKSHGCIICGHKKTTKSQIINAKLKFKAEAELKHPDKYDYTMVWYRNNKKGVLIWCKSCKKFFLITPSDLLSGVGHSECANWGFKYDKPATLYYLRVEYDELIAYKIGITNRSVEERFCDSDLEKITIIKTWEYDLGSDTYDKEQAILKEFKEFQYCGDPLLSSNGNTELFIKDVLNLDK